MSIASWTPTEFAQECEDAAAKGFKVVVEQEDELLLDIDQVYNPKIDLISPHQDFVYACLGVQFKEVIRQPSKSGNTHIVIKLDKPLEKMQKLALRLFLGSDPRRELMHIPQWANGIENPVVLFQKEVPLGS